MTKRKLAQAIAKIEGKKSEVAIGNIMEVLTILEELQAQQFVDGSTAIVDAIDTRIYKLIDKKRKKMRALSPS